MKKYRKLIAPVLIGTMLFGSMQFALAEEDTVAIDNNQITENNTIVPLQVY